MCLFPAQNRKLVTPSENNVEKQALIVLFSLYYRCIFSIICCILLTLWAGQNILKAWCQ